MKKQIIIGALIFGLIMGVGISGAFAAPAMKIHGNVWSDKWFVDSGTGFGMKAVGLTGVYGFGSSTGVKGDSGENGIGVSGKCLGATDGFGVYGTGPTGVCGETNMEGGKSVSGYNGMNNGIGVYGYDANTNADFSKAGTGVIGNSLNGIGVIGVANSWEQAKVSLALLRFETSSVYPSAVGAFSDYATALTALSQNKDGIVGATASTSSSQRGVYGRATAGMGVEGKSDSGFGVKGTSKTATGGYFTGHMGVYGMSEAADGVGVVALNNNGTAINVSGGIEISRGDKAVYSSDLSYTNVGRAGSWSAAFTIDKPVGTVTNLSGRDAYMIVTNKYVTANSIVFATSQGDTDNKAVSMAVQTPNGGAFDFWLSNGRKVAFLVVN